MKKHIPNFITCLNVLTGTVGIAIIFQGEESAAIIFILIASVFDFLDGMVARLLKVQSEIGKQLDSLADLVSFGVLPALTLMYMINSSITIQASLPMTTYWSFAALLIVPFSALRLAKFNLANAQTDEFKGLPTPANALMITAIAFASPEFMTLGFFIVLTTLSCFLLVSNIPMIGLKFKSMAWKGNELRYLLIIIEVLGLTIFWFSFIPFVIPAYIAVSVVGNLLHRMFVILI